jgi:hypothetical protein
MAASPTRIRLDVVLKLCEAYGYGPDMLELILFLENAAYPILYPAKDKTKE